MNEQDTNIDATLPEREQEILDTALLESDQLLVRSLHDDQRRRRKLGWLSVLIVGGVAMGTLLVGTLLGWFAIGGQVVTETSAGADTDADLAKIERAEVLTETGWKLWGQRKFAAAAEKFQAATKADPESANAWNGLGWSKFNGGHSPQAIPAFEKCVALQPKHPAALNGLGQIYLFWKEYEKAEKYLLLAAPEAPASWYGLTRLYLLQGKYKEAQKWGEKLVGQGSPGQTEKQMLAAAKAGKLDDELRRLIEPAGKPSGTPATTSDDSTNGWLMFQKGRMRTAERLFRRALKQNENDLSALNGLGFALLSQGNHEQAQPLFEKYLEKEKDAPGPLNGLARCLKASGKVDKAIELWERSAKKYPGPTAAAYGLASTYLERKEYAKAAKYYQVLVDADKKNKEYQNGLKQAQAGNKTTK